MTSDGDVLWVRKRNARLLEFMAKKLLPECRDQLDVSMDVNAKVGVLLVGAGMSERGDSDEAASSWEDQFGGKVLPERGSGLPGDGSSGKVEDANRVDRA